MCNKDFLRSKGFIVGRRDYSRKTSFAGSFMVAQTIYPHEDPSNNSAYCIVGNDLDELVEEAIRHFGF